ncbi:AAA family ATPase [Granulicella arctica]|uniref:AAA family ATPase n=1 Tax=Granulicella arctica TaxID=940613 RepID=UPI0021DF86C5|nr:ATP-binding protein [Granulicella arctica]
MEQKQVEGSDVVQLARLALIGKPKDIQMYVRRLINRYKLLIPELADQLGTVLREAPKHSSPLRGAAVEAIPVDLDSRLQLARPEFPVILPSEPVWDSQVKEQLEQMVLERERQEELFQAGLHPTKSALFTGAPGVGKTLAARWLAQRLNCPLITLDLSAVMSSFLGRTGNNVRNVLDYAKGIPCVFLLDEFDAIAKRRDDAVEIGELKRLVTVLLQEIDEWPASGLLIAATNHPELLDPAVWRRFEVLVKFPMPLEEQMRESILRHIGESDNAAVWSRVLARTLQGSSFADAEREILRAKRQAIIRQQSVTEQLKELVHDRSQTMSREDRSLLALDLLATGLSQRDVNDWTGVSRDTIRKALKQVN